MRMAAGASAVLGALALGVAIGFLLGARTPERERGQPPPEELWAAGIRAALAEEDRLAQTARLVPILEALSPLNLALVVGSYEESFSSGGPGDRAFELLMEAWGRFDAPGAYLHVLGWPADFRRMAMPALLRAMARTAPREALAAYEALDDPLLGSEAQHQLLVGWAESGDPGLWLYLAAQEREQTREALSNTALYRIARRKGAAGLLAEAENLPEEPPLADFKPKAIRSAVGVAARIDPEVAARFVERVRGGPYDVRLLRRLAVNWVTRDGPAAMAWLRSQPEGEERNRILRETYRRWIVRDRPAALEWMRGVGDHGDLPMIYDLYASGLTRIDPQAAVAWVDAEVADPALRREALLDIARVWQSLDREAAEAWIAERGLDADLRREAESRAERHRVRERSKAGAAAADAES